MRTRGVLAAFCLTGTLAVQADPLPQPLSLEQALLLAESSHPTLQLATAREASAAANLRQVSSRNDLSVSLLGRLAYLEPAELSNFQQNNDSSAHLLMEKRLYDFGYSEAQEASAERELDAARLAGLDVRQQHRIEVMKAFFDVLLADLEYARDNQASLRSRERFWDIRVPKIDSIFDNSLVPRPSWSPGVPPQHRKLVAATHRSPI